MNEIGATVALDGDTRRCCDNPDCNNVWPCKLHPDTSGGRGMMTAEQLAQLFHETYERLAPQFGYVTRRDSANPWAEVPEVNRKLMIATCAEVLRDAAAQLAEKEREIARLEQQLATANLAALQASSACQAEMQSRSTWMNRALDAEQQLQEAQARIKYLENVKVRAGRGERSTS